MSLLGEEDVKQRVREVAEHKEKEKGTSTGGSLGEKVKRVSVGAAVRVVEWVIERD